MCTTDTAKTLHLLIPKEPWVTAARCEQHQCDHCKGQPGAQASLREQPEWAEFLHCQQSTLQSCFSWGLHESWAVLPMNHSAQGAPPHGQHHHKSLTSCGHEEPSLWCALFSDTSAETKCLEGQQSHNKGAPQHLSLKAHNVWALHMYFQPLPPCLLCCVTPWLATELTLLAGLSWAVTKSTSLPENKISGSYSKELSSKLC